MTEIWLSSGENSLQGCVVKSLDLEGHPDWLIGVAST